MPQCLQVACFSGCGEHQWSANDAQRVSATERLLLLLLLLLHPRDKASPDNRRRSSSIHHTARVLPAALVTACT